MTDTPIQATRKQESSSLKKIKQQIGVMRRLPKRLLIKGGLGARVLSQNELVGYLVRVRLNLKSNSNSFGLFFRNIFKFLIF